MARPWLMLFVALMLGATSCQTGDDKKKDKDKLPPRDESQDMSFQAFLGRLRKAVAGRDVHMIASMMTPTFGYRLDPLGEGEGVFQYWDENDLWDELNLVLHEKFVAKGSFMIAPPQFATESEYTGYRAGITMVGGSWKFAYFVSG